MFSRRTETDVHTTATVARGGVSLWSVLTGVLVAFGTMFLLAAIVGALAVSTGLEDELASGDAVEVGIGVAAAFVIAQFVAYLWGGYTAGRMARGAGAINGLLVPIVALALSAAVYGIAYALGETATLNLPFVENRLPLENDALLDLGVGAGIGSLVAMLLGGLLGGLAGARWHTKLERAALAEHDAQTIDITEGRTTVTHPATAGTIGAAGAGTDLHHDHADHVRDDLREGHVHDEPVATTTSPTPPAPPAGEPIRTRPVTETTTDRR